MALQFPLNRTVVTTGDPVVSTDRFGNEVITPGKPVEVAVLGWNINRTEEKNDESILRTIDDLELIAPPESFEPDRSVKLPDGSVWEIQGNAEDANNNPWWAPGLVVFHGKKVEG